MINIKAATIGLGIFAAISYLVCIIFGLIVPENFHMKDFLEIAIPGFQWLTAGSFFWGLLVSIFYGVYTGIIFSPVYNALYKRLSNE